MHRQGTGRRPGVLISPGRTMRLSWLCGWQSGACEEGDVWMASLSSEGAACLPEPGASPRAQHPCLRGQRELPDTCPSWPLLHEALMLSAIHAVSWAPLSGEVPPPPLVDPL